MDLALFIYHRAVNVPTPAGLLITAAAAAAAVVLAARLRSRGKWRWPARVLFLLGLAAIMLVLWIVREQTDIEKQGPRVTVTTTRFSDLARLAATGALVAAPILALIYVVSARRAAHHRLAQPLATDSIDS